MIIVPTEKQFDWRHAPLVLFVLVIANVLIFFLYQSGDQKKLATAVEAYSNADYLEAEWPVFQKFLVQRKEEKLLSEYREQYQDENYENLISEILLRDDFFDYLRKNGRAEFTHDFYDQWDIERQRINNQVQSMSYLAYGLRADRLKIITFITHQFLHGSIMHLLGNMFFLIVCGFAVEAAIGHWRFLAFYLVSGVAAGLSQSLFNWESAAPLIGASGAISGVMAMYLAVFRLKKIEFFYWFFFFVGYFRAPALLILPLYIGKEVHSFYSDTESNVAFMAHAGGFVTGALLISLAFLFNRNIFNTAYIESDLRVDPRQQKLAAIYDCIEKYRFERALGLVDELIKEQGLHFDVAMIKYNLLKINRDQAYLPATHSLLTVPLLSSGEIKALDKVWRDNPEVHALLTHQQALKLGIQLSSLDDPSSAEQIFNQLHLGKCVDSSMAVLANKLAKAFSLLRDFQKKDYYDAQAIALGRQAASQFPVGAKEI